MSYLGSCTKGIFSEMIDRIKQINIWCPSETCHRDGLLSRNNWLSVAVECIDNIILTSCRWWGQQMQGEWLDLVKVRSGELFFIQSLHQLRRICHLINLAFNVKDTYNWYNKEEKVSSKMKNTRRNNRSSPVTPFLSLLLLSSICVSWFLVQTIRFSIARSENLSFWTDAYRFRR